MNIIVRVDASLQVGTGHVMRCLTLADALREHGAQCRFICRAHSGHLAGLIEQRGHGVALLPLVATAPPTPAGATVAITQQQPSHAAWLGEGITQQTDAQDTLAAISPASVDWLIVDHYALDHRWESALRPACQRLMVIDDLADRPHDCDLLLDQNLGRQKADYATLTPARTIQLIGPAFALLRPEFAQWRPYSLARRAERPGLRRLLITMGGVDNDNITEQVLKAIASRPLSPDVHITVVMGPNAPWLKQVRAQAAGMPHATEVLCGVTNMAQLMADADLAIGAAGGTAWECCCLGLPTILLVLASNQKDSARALVSQNAAMLAHSVEQIPYMLHQLSNPQRTEAVPSLLASAQASQSITDGTGAVHLAGVMSSQSFLPEGPSVRKMRDSDLPIVLAWRNHPTVRQHMLTQHEITLEEHTRWFARASQDPSRSLLIVEENGQPLGYVQFSNLQQEAAAEWGFYVVPGAPKGGGRKLGVAALTYAFQTLSVHKVCGQALSTNHASIAFHQSLGFQQEGILREQHFIHGQWLSTVCFGLLASEWHLTKTFAS